MRKAVAVSFLLGLALSFVPSIAVGLSPPLNPGHEIVDEQHGFMSVEFEWDKNLELVDPLDPHSDLEVEWYHLIYTCLQNCPNNQGDAVWVIQPNGPGPVSRLFVGGFDYSLPTAQTRYQWRVGACSAQASGACVYTASDYFTTRLHPPPPMTPGPPTPPPTIPGPPSGGPPGVLENPISSKTLPQLLENVLNFLFGLSLVIMPIIIIYGGILLLTAGGDPQKISQSRTILLWAVIAFAIILLARGLPTVLRGLL